MAGIDLGRFKGKKKDEWLDWLADDPVPASIRGRMRSKAVQDASRPVVRRVGEAPQTPGKTQTGKETSTRGTRSVSINIAIPKIKKPQFVVPEKLRVSRKQGIAGGIAAFIMIGGIIGFIALNNRNKSTTSEGAAVLSQKTEKPAFDYSLPKGSEEELNGPVRYDSEKKVVNFQDSIGGIAITVSQQPLPEGLKEDTANKVKKLAEDFSATEALTTATPTAYLGTSAKGPQTVVFAKNKLLVFIQSEKKIENRDWAEYITNLK